MGLKTGIDATSGHGGGVRAPKSARACGGTSNVTVWQGASGRQIAHDVYSLIECPALVDAVYLLVRRSRGRRRVLAIAQTETPVASLNLAQVRQQGAQHGANEVHVHACGDARARTQVERDLSQALAAAH